MTFETARLATTEAGPNYSDTRTSFLLLDFRGRIGRAQFWWGLGLLTLANLALTMVFALLFGVTPEAYFHGAKTASVIDLVVLAGLAFPTLALLTKRLNDRDMGPWLGILFYLLLFFVSVELYFRVPERLKELDFVALLPVAMTLGVFGWLLIECGLLPAFDDNASDTEPPTRDGDVDGR